MTTMSNQTDILLITPPMTQLNTPYPATAYLSNYLRRNGYTVEQSDLGIELILRVFSPEFLNEIFDILETDEDELSESAERIILTRKHYASTVSVVIAFLQGKQQTLAHRIVSREFLPEGERFSSLDQLPATTFGEMSLYDKAKLICTLYLEDLAGFLQETICPHFTFSRYAEQISKYLPDFSPMDEYLQEEPDIISNEIISLIHETIERTNPKVIGFSVPFPGNLYAALLCAKSIKEHYPEIKTILGGGFVNTELRQLSEPRVFNYFDYVTLDDGELPLQRILEQSSKNDTQLIRTFICDNNCVSYSGMKQDDEISHDESGWPDYTGLSMDNYLNTFDMANPMNRMWSDGRWNKLTIAHGCYWKKCTFCDVSLDYISRYSETTAEKLCDRIEEIITQTGESGFHFVDEACPPDLLVQLSIEILKRNLQITWWGNIRFEKAFTIDAARLMARAGCIAVSGGLEVAEERLLKLIRKGTGIPQTVQALTAFKEAGIMAHAYLMYGYPTQTAQETINSLEVVRQLFSSRLLKSAFWHRFALTAHSPVFADPSHYDIKPIIPEHQGFAWNDVSYNETNNTTDHASFADGLRTAVYNYMHNNCLETPVDEWFEGHVPSAVLPKRMVENEMNKALQQQLLTNKNARLLWNGHARIVMEEKAGYLITTGETLEIPFEIAEWLHHLLPQLNLENTVTFGEVEEFFIQYFPESTFDDLVHSEIWIILKKDGLLCVDMPPRHKAQTNS